MNGYTCFLLRGGTLRIPANERRIRDVRKLLKAMWLVKVCIHGDGAERKADDG